MLNHLYSVFFGTFSFRVCEPFFFVGYLISIASSGLLSGNFYRPTPAPAWDKCKEIVLSGD